jgi:hypothetical protein
MSYIPAVKEAAWRIGSEYGLRGLFKIICFSYFFANLRYEEVTPEMSDWCVSLSLEVTDLDEEDKQALALLFENSLKLNEKFRDETAAVYFGFLGCHDEFTAVYRLNLVDNSYQLSRYLDAVNILTDLVVSGVRLEDGPVHDLVTSSPVSQHRDWSRVRPVQLH